MQLNPSAFQGIIKPLDYRVYRKVTVKVDKGRYGYPVQ
jgi:hypothetical protein